MRIGDLAMRTQCSRDTIRFYQKVGLVSGTRERAGTNNYRDYDERMVNRILLIKHAKVLGFTLAEIKGIIGAWEGGALSHAKKVKLFQDKILLVESKIAELRQVKRYLDTKLKALRGASTAARNAADR